MTISRWERGIALPEGATERLLYALFKKVGRRAIPSNVTDLVKGALVGTAVGAALIVLLDGLFGED
jgi:hypothetical protein